VTLPSAVGGPAAWRGDALREEQWLVELTAQEQDELATGAPLTALGPRLAQWRRQLQSGLGFLLVRGVPVDCVDPEGVFRRLGRHLGEEVPQNGAGDLLCHIRDTGADPADPDVRLYTTRAEQDFHTDGADLIGLLCLQTAREGGRSLLASSVTVFNEVAARRPDLVHLLFEDWHWYLHGQQPGGTPPTFAAPIARWDGRHLATFFLGWWIRRAQGVPGVPPLTPAQAELLALYEQVANEPGIALEMDFRPGDMQWLKNSVTLHKRTEYVDDPARPRHLLRLWLAARDFEDGDELLRGGIPTSV
jgi:hypothetical protein